MNIIIINDILLKSPLIIPIFLRSVFNHALHLPLCFHYTRLLGYVTNTSTNQRRKPLYRALLASGERARQL